MKSDGLVPFAFADKDLWPALGLFDILNLRINGYDYHIKLMHNKASYTDPQVTAVFNQWAELLPYMQSGATGRIWEDAAKTLEAKQAGHDVPGHQPGRRPVRHRRQEPGRPGFFPFPTINPSFGQDYIDAPMDGFILPAKAKNKDAAKQVLEYIGTGAAEASYLKYDQWDVAWPPAPRCRLTTPSRPLRCKRWRASRASRSSATGTPRRRWRPPLETAIQNFIANPATSGIKPMQSSLASQAKSIFG